MNLAGFSTLVDARYSQIKSEEYAGITDIVPLIYTKRNTDRLDQYHTSIGGLGEWEEFTGQIQPQRMYEQYPTTSRPRAFATMTILDRRMMTFDLSGILDGKQHRQMVRAGMKTKQMHATEPFEMLTVNDTRWFVRGEGVPIVSNNHLTRTPNVSMTDGYDNYTPDTLSPASVLSAKIAGRKMKSSEGQRMDMYYDTALVTIDTVDTLNEILNTPRGFDIPGLNENQASRERSGIKNIICLPEWTSTTAWALVNMALMRENCYWFTAEEEDYGSIVEFDTLQIKSRGYMDHGPHIDGWQWIYGGGM